MKIVNWIAQGLLAFAFLGAGAMKLFTPYAQMVDDPNMAWTMDFSELQIKLISIAEILGAFGLIIPMFVAKIRPIVPVASSALAVVMIGAIFTHLGRGEPVIVNIILLLLASYVTFSRRGYFKKQQPDLTQNP